MKKSLHILAYDDISMEKLTYEHIPCCYHLGIGRRALMGGGGRFATPTKKIKIRSYIHK